MTKVHIKWPPPWPSCYVGLNRNVCSILFYFYGDNDMLINALKLYYGESFHMHWEWDCKIHCMPSVLPKEEYQSCRQQNKSLTSEEVDGAFSLPLREGKKQRIMWSQCRYTVHRMIFALLLFRRRYYCFLCLCQDRNLFHTVTLLIIINHPCSYENWHFHDWFTHCCLHPLARAFEHISLKIKTNLLIGCFHACKCIYGNQPSHAFVLRYLICLTVQTDGPCRWGDGWFH